MNLGKTISDIRKGKNISQKGLSELTNLSQTYLSQIENNKKMPNTSTLEKISKALDVPLPIIFFLSIDEEDVPKNKRNVYSEFFPSIESLVRDVFLPYRKKKDD